MNNDYAISESFSYNDIEDLFDAGRDVELVDMCSRFFSESSFLVLVHVLARFGEEQKVDELIDSCQKRGFRESALKELRLEKERGMLMGGRNPYGEPFAERLLQRQKQIGRDLARFVWQSRNRRMQTELLETKKTETQILSEWAVWAIIERDFDAASLLLNAMKVKEDRHAFDIFADDLCTWYEKWYADWRWHAVTCTNDVAVVVSFLRSYEVCNSTLESTFCWDPCYEPGFYLDYFLEEPWVDGMSVMQNATFNPPVVLRVLQSGKVAWTEEVAREVFNSESAAESIVEDATKECKALLVYLLDSKTESLSSLLQRLHNVKCKYGINSYFKAILEIAPDDRSVRDMCLSHAHKDSDWRLLDWMKSKGYC
jgi:hypothetical protein